jgi:hypothetical protein
MSAARMILLAGVLAFPSTVDAKPARGDAGRLLALGDSLLEAGDHHGAEAAYATVVSWGWTSAALAHNRGLAAFREGRTGEAVAYLLDARGLAAGEPAILQSLAAARASAGIAASGFPGGRLLRLITRPAGILALVLIAAALGLGAVLQRRRRELALVLAVAAGAAWALGASAWVSSAPRGTVLSATSLRASPASASAERMALRAGRTVVLGREYGQWVRVRVPNGPGGWVPAATLAE